MGDELKPVAWRNANGAVTNFTHGAEAWEKAGIECEPLYPASALTALREENERLRDRCKSLDKEAADGRVIAGRHKTLMSEAATVLDETRFRATAAETEAATLRALLAEAEKALDDMIAAASCQPIAGNPEADTNWGLHNDWRGWFKKIFTPAERAARAVSAKIKEMTGE